MEVKVERLCSDITRAKSSDGGEESSSGVEISRSSLAVKGKEDIHMEFIPRVEVKVKAFDPEEVQSMKEIDVTFHKYTSYFGSFFKNAKTEFRFLSEHSILNKRTVYAGYIFQIILMVIDTIISVLLTVLARSICGTDKSKSEAIEACRDMIYGHSKKESVHIVVIFFSLAVMFIGIIVHALIHSKRVQNKAWSMLAVWIVYFVQLCGVTVQIVYLDSHDTFWALKSFLCYVSIFIIAVWFTGLIFWMNLLLFLVTGSVYFGTAIHLAIKNLNAFLELENTKDLLEHTTFITTAPALVTFSAIALASSYMNDRTARMRFLQRLYITHEQNNVILQKTRSEAIQRSFLENMLPASIVSKLQETSFSLKSFKNLSQRHQGVCILFADIAGFTSFATQVDSAAVMTFLNELFLQFDDLCDQYNVYKLETIGDCYVAAVGVVTGQMMATEMDQNQLQKSNLAEILNTTSISNTVDLLRFAEAMIKVSRGVTKPTVEQPALIRVGIHTGPCMSGIVGTRNLRYCLFGDSMNIAARMEQTGVVDAIHASEVVAKLTPDELWEARGGVSVKGKGLMETYLLQVPDD